MTIQGGDYDLSTSDGRAMARVVTVFSRKESDDKSRRTRAMHERLAREGKWVGGGLRQFGYSDVHKTRVVEAEAVVIRGAADLLLSGASKSEVVRWMNERSTGTGGRRGRRAQWRTS